MTTKIPAELSSTPGISDSSNATAITIDSSENTTFGGDITVSGSSPEVTFQTGASHYNWQIAAQENLSSALEISVGSADADASNDTFSPKIYVKQAGDIQIVDGDLILSNGGIDFSATGNASGMSSELLDDYEEGTWTAVHGGNNMTGNGYYVKVGGLVHFQGDWTSASGSTSTQIITGLPFNSSTSRGHCAFSVGYTTDTGQVGGYTQSNAIYLINSGADSANELAAGQRVIIQGTYSTVE